MNVSHRPSPTHIENFHTDKPRVDKFFHQQPLRTGTNVMRQTAHQVFYVYMIIAATTAMTALADERSSGKALPDGNASHISEWGMSGLIWSEASLVKKLAVETARTQPDLSDDELRQLEQIADEHELLIESMEAFGWKRLQKSQRRSATGRNDADGSQGSAALKRLPDPQSVGQELAESMGITSEEKPAREANLPAEPAENPMTAKGLKRYDTETPAGRDDPGLDDERTADDLKIDIDQYRVDDYVDETPAEARNLADAREDGVEKAIAAADPEGIAGPTAGYISRREVQTRSATMAYSQDSIYDADDYDPDADYDVEHPLTERKMNREAANMLDGDDDISVRKPAIAAEGEDELLAAMERGGTRDRDVNILGPSSGASPQSDSNQPTHSPRRYNQTLPTTSADANWVSLHLTWNENRWYAAKKSGLSMQVVLDAVDQFQTTMQTIVSTSDSPRLRERLKRRQ